MLVVDSPANRSKHSTKLRDISVVLNLQFFLLNTELMKY